jgi:uncharacterized protein
MENVFAPTRLDVKALAQSGAEMAGRDVLSRFERLAQDLQGTAPDGGVEWAVRCELRPGAAGKDDIWLNLRVATAMPMVCQRCLGPVDMPVAFDRWFRFVATEAAAEEQDDDAEEDLLVMSREFNLAELMEDELLLDLPVVPRHELCPTEVKMAVADADFEGATEAKPNPFAVLSKLQNGKLG